MAADFGKSNLETKKQRKLPYKSIYCKVEPTATNTTISMLTAVF